MGPLGVFATRSPYRPDPIAWSVARLLGVDGQRGTVEVDWLDAREGTAVVDLKPYSPSVDRVADPVVPSWAASWPMALEESADFDWSGVLGED